VFAADRHGRAHPSSSLTDRQGRGAPAPSDGRSARRTQAELPRFRGERTQGRDLPASARLRRACSGSVPESQRKLLVEGPVGAVGKRAPRSPGARCAVVQGPEGNHHPNGTRSPPRARGCPRARPRPQATSCVHDARALATRVVPPHGTARRRRPPGRSGVDRPAMSNDERKRRKASK
jgi:hypothetical protein